MLGIFDSGLGGLTVVKEIKDRHPRADFIYFGDTARVPWGNKSQQIVQQYADEICQFLLDKGATEIVIACNTASALAADYLRQKYSEVKIHDVISPVIDRIEKEATGKDGLKIGLIGTKGTISSKTYEKKIKEAGNGIVVYAKSCPLFVPLVEEGWMDHGIAAQVAHEYLDDLVSREITKLVLGCTHYPLLINTIKKVVGKKVEVISSAEEIAKTIKLKGKEGSACQETFYFSDWTDSYQQLVETIMDKPIFVQKVQL